MRRLSRILFALLIGVLFLEVLVLAPDQINFEEQMRDEEEESTQAEQMMYKVHLIESKDGKKDWELFANSAEGNLGKKAKWKLNKIKTIFFGSDGFSYVVTAKRAEIFLKSKDITFSGDVLTQSSNGFEIKSQLINYQGVNKLLVSPADVNLSGPRDQNGNRLKLVGKNMIVNINTSIVKMDSQVKAERIVSEGKSISISSQKAEFNGKNQAARFANGVEINYGNLVIKGPEAFFEYNPGSDVPSSVFINGGVNVIGESKIATAENLKVDFDTDRYLFKGSPKVQHQGDIIVGDEIIFLEGGKRVKIEKVKAQVKDKK